MEHTHSGLVPTNDTNITQVKIDLLALNERQRRNFEKKIDKSGGPDACWDWQGATGDHGYGIFSISGVIRMAHRISYRLYVGSFPNELKVCHKCDRVCCTNPLHLFLGTQADNVADMDAKGRRNMAKGAANASIKYPGIRRGERNGSAILTEAIVIEMRRRYHAGGVTFKQLADEIGITKCSAHAAIRGATWGHIKPETPSSEDAAIIAPETESPARPLPASPLSQSPEF